MYSIDLSENGFDDCKLICDKCELSGILPSYKDLRFLTKKDEHYVLNKELKDKTLPAYLIHQELPGGKYGRIYQALRTCYNKTPYEYMNVIIKEIGINISTKEEIFYGKETATLNAIQSNLYEGIIHSLVKKMFQTIGLGSLIPTLFEISARIYGESIKIPSDIKCINMAMEYIHGYTLYDYCKVHLTKIHNAAFHDHMPLPILNARIRNEKLFVDILVQLCCYLDVLQTNLRFNHRDLNINNILVRKNMSSSRLSSTTIRNIVHPALLTTYECKTDIVLIDFGFSCFACSKSNKSSLEAGSYFKPDYDCLKPGRDIAIFLYSFNAVFPFIHHFSNKFCDFLQSLMVAFDNKKNEYSLLKNIQIVDKTFDSVSNKKIEDKITHIQTKKSEKYIDDKISILKESDKLIFDEKMYLFLKKDDIEVPYCEPVQVLRFLQKNGYVL